MHKKIEIWILYFTILFSVLITIGFGVLVRQEISGDTKLGKFDISFLSKPAAYLAGLPAKTFKQLLKSNPNKINDPWDEQRYFYTQKGFEGMPNLYESYFLFSRYDGDLGEGVVELIDLTNFEVLHTWNPDIDAFNDMVDQVDEFKNLKTNDNNKRKTLMHPTLTNDGGLLFGWNSPLRKIDKCSNLIFHITDDIFHHSIELDKEGNIWAPSHIYPQSLSEEKVGNKSFFESGYLDDAIVKLSSNGEVLYKKSVSQIFIDNNLEYLLYSGGNLAFNRDPIHLNDIQPVDFDGEYWKKGDVFLSLRHQSMVLLYRPSTNEIIWKGTGPFFHQHDVNILDDHRISIFNNNAKLFINGRKVDGNNRVLIYDFKTDTYSSYLEESLAVYDVRSPKEGRGEIIYNNDLYIEETDFGRSLYFNADGSIRWTHVNQANDGRIYKIGWSRILYKKADIEIINMLMKSKGMCSD